MNLTLCNTKLKFTSFMHFYYKQNEKKRKKCYGNFTFLTYIIIGLYAIRKIV